MFADNDRPGILLAGAARTYLHRYGVLVGRRVVVFTTNDSAYAAAADLADAGVQVAAVVDTRPQAPDIAAGLCRDRGIDVRTGSVVTGTDGTDRVTAVHVAAITGDGDGRGAGLRRPAGLRRLEPRRAPVQPGPRKAPLRPRARGVPARRSRCPRCGWPAPPPATWTSMRCVAGARDAAAAALGALGVPAGPAAELPRSTALWLENPPAVLWSVPGPGGTSRSPAPTAPARTAPGPGRHPVRGPAARRHRRRRAARHRGGPAVGGARQAVHHHRHRPRPGQDLRRHRLRDHRRRPRRRHRRTRHHHLPAAVRAGAVRRPGRPGPGDLFDPIRTTAIHPWHVENGAEFEDVGQWKRPWYYPQGGEDMHAAVRRECRAARTGVGIMDGSTLGKIDVQGADAGWFLDLLYTNLMSTLKVGFIRYGVMCGPDGMVIDDGTVIRVADDRFLVTTTTGNAAKILDWMEEWLQTEWPQLRVTATSVTEHWATIPLVGPRSRDVLAAVTTDLDVSNDAFPFMTWRDTSIAGAPVRVCRISFSGELAYEVNVRAWEGLEVWRALIAAGEPFGITPYGTETMHVLRAEKGFPIIGQETDGTVTPQDLGMSWAVSKKKIDFLGKRSFSPPGEPAGRPQTAHRHPARRPHRRAARGQPDRARPAASPPR